MRRCHPSRLAPLHTAARRGLFLLCALALGVGLPPGPLRGAIPEPYRVKDIYAGSSSGTPSQTASLGGILYFRGTDAAGAELWKSDGTEAGTVMVKDICPGAAGSSPAYPINLNGTLLFAATDGAAGVELWKSDGTTDGTVLLKDINPGSGGSDPLLVTIINGTLYFRATEDSAGEELWKTDGTAAGTVRVRDIYPGASSSGPANFEAMGNTLFFIADDGVHGKELWKSDGTEAGTVLVKDINPGASNSTAAYITALGSTLVFSANDGTHGIEIWKSDGTEAGTVLLKDIRAGASSSTPNYMVAIGSHVLFGADDGINGREPWVTDGTPAGTVLLKDLNPGAGGGGFANTGVVGNFVYFPATDGTAGSELWRSDGTPAGTTMVCDINPGANGSGPGRITDVAGTVYFRANDGTHGIELWRSDGTAFGTRLMGDINPGANSSTPESLTDVAGTLFFSADDSATGVELYSTDRQVVSVNSASVAEGNAGATLLNFPVSLTFPAKTPVTVQYATADGTATAGSDYTAAAGTLTFSAGEFRKTIAVTVAGDTRHEPDETISLALSGPENAALGDSQGTGTITNDDALPTVSVGDVTIAEGNSGMASAVFAVTLSAASGQMVTVDWATTGDTATSGSDFVASAGTLAFNAGQNTTTLSVPVFGDREREPNETFRVTLYNPKNAALADPQGTGTIADEDPVPSLSLAGVTADEGNSGTTPFAFAVTLSAPSSEEVRVAYATSTGSAAASDFTAASGTLVFAPGETGKSVEVAVLGDTTDEYDERFVVALSSPVNATIAQAQALGVILNDDVPPALSVGDVAATEGNVGNKVAGITVSLSAASSKVVVVDYSCGDATAVAGSDYNPVAGTLRYAPGQTSRTVNLAIKGDAIREGNETFTLTLVNAVNATVARATGIATITCDDTCDPAVGLAVEVADAAAGAVFAATVRAVDGAGSTDPSFRAAVSVVLKSGPAGAALAGATSTTAVAGVARFTSLILTKPGTYVLTAAGGGFTADSSSFTVGAGTPTRLVFPDRPANQIAGQPLDAVSVHITDNWGNIVTSATDEVTVEIGANPGGGALQGTTTVAAAGGIATFTNLAVSASGAAYTLRAMASGLRWGTSQAFTIHPAGPQKVAFLTMPSNAAANAAIAPAVRVAVQDAMGNLVPTATNAVTLVLYANPAGARLLGTKTVNAVNGIATFADLKVDKAAAGLRLRASGTGLSGVDSTPFTISAAAPAPPAGRPDLLLWDGNAGAGEGVFQPSPAEPQVAALAVPAGRTAAHQVALRNAGPTARAFFLKALLDAPAGWSVVYKVGEEDVTARLAAGCATKVLAPGEALLLTVEMTPAAGTPAGSQCTVTLPVLMGPSDKTVRDVVQVAAMAD